MNLIEFIGFVISLAAVTFLFIKKMLEDRERRRNPEEYARREAAQQENLRRFLNSSGYYEEERKRHIRFEEDEDEEEELRPLPRPRKTAERIPSQRPPAPSFYQTERVSPVEERYDVIRVEGVSKAGKTLKSLRSPREMLIIKEIFDKPLSMRDK